MFPSDLSVADWIVDWIKSILLVISILLGAKYVVTVTTYFFKFQLRFSFVSYSMGKIRKNLSKAKLFFIIIGCFSWENDTERQPTSPKG